MWHELLLDDATTERRDVRETAMTTEGFVAAMVEAGKDWDVCLYVEQYGL